MMTKIIRGEERERKRGIFYYENYFPNADKQVPAKRNRNLSLPECYQPRHRFCWGETLSDDEKNKEKKQLNSEPFRRHSWSSGINACGIDYRDIGRPGRKCSQESRIGNSNTSIPDIIEECTSDDEETSLGSDVVPEVTNELRCRYCFQKDNTVMIVKTDKYPYCKKCRDLLRNKNKFGNMLPTPSVNEQRKAPTVDYLSTSPPRRMRKTSLPETLDLPCIEEPLSGEEASDTKELQLLVEKEVHKLIRFGSKGKGGKTLFCHQRRRNSDDLDLIAVGLKKMLIHKSADLIP